MSENMKEGSGCCGSCGCNANPLLEQLKVRVREIKKNNGTKLMCLQEAQHIYGFLAVEAIEYIARKMETSTTELYSIASFYSQFKFVKQGRYRISLCLGTACYVKGANLVQAKLEESLGIKLGSTTSDGKWTLDSARCVGCCGLAPVMLINDKVYPTVSPAKVEAILKEYEGR